MGRIITAICDDCNRIFNFDEGIGKAYTKKRLLDMNNSFNLTTLYYKRTEKQKLEFKDMLLSGMWKLSDDYGHRVAVCLTCNQLYPRFYFKLINEDVDKIFEPKFKCHTCRRKLKLMNDDELFNEKHYCPYCKKEIKFYVSGEWN